MTKKLWALVAIVGTLALSSACQRRATDVTTGGLPARSQLQEVPQPDLSASEEAVRRQITAAFAKIERLLEHPSMSAEELGQAFGDLGLLYVTYSFLEAAETCFRNAELLLPADYSWPYLLGYLFQIQGRLAEADRVLTRTLKLLPDDRPALIRLGTVRLELADNDRARHHFERALELNPRSAAALSGLGRAAAAMGDAEQAVRYFERALELQPQASSLRHALGLAYRRFGDREKARLNLEMGGDAQVLFEDPLLSPVTELGRSAELFLVRAAQAFSEERYAQAAEIYRRALEIDPQDFTTHKALGFCLQKLGDLKAAIAQLEVALATATTGDPERDEQERSELLRIKGGLRVLQGLDGEAIEAFSRSLELTPDRLDTHLKLANALARGRRFAEAIAHYDRVLEELPEHSGALVQRATALINLGRSREALADFERAVAAKPEDPEPRLRFAEALEHLGRTADARSQRADAESLAASDQTRSRLALAEAQQRLRSGDFQGAEHLLREALALDPDLTDARFELANLLGHLHRYEEALAEFSRVVREVPWHGPARRGEVTSLLLQNRYAEARERLREGLSVMPRDRSLAHGLARLLAIAPQAGLRRADTALRLAQRVHAAGPGPETTETLAMAFGAVGRFEQATALQRELLTEAEAAGDLERARGLRERLQSFEAHQAWQARSPDEIIVAIVASAAQTVPTG